MSKVRRSKPPRQGAKPPMNAAPASAPVTAAVADLAGTETPMADTPDGAEPDAVTHASDVLVVDEATAPVEALIAPEPVAMTAPADLPAPVDALETAEPVAQTTALVAQSADTLADVAETTTAFLAETVPSAPLPALADALPAADALPVAASLVPTPRLQAETVGTAVMNYFIAEGEAFAAHMRALAKARSMGEIVRLQIGEFQRGADAMLSCWGLLTITAGRTVTAR